MSGHWDFYVDRKMTPSQALVKLSDLAHEGQTPNPCRKQLDGTRISTVYCVVCEITRMASFGIPREEQD